MEGKMIITDIKWKNKNNEEREGYYMDTLLIKDLNWIPELLKEDWNPIGIISSHGGVRMGMGTIAMQVGYYISWNLAGGQMEMDKEKEDYGRVINKPTKDINFSDKNVVNSEKELIAKAKKLPKNSVIICQGLENLFENYPSLSPGLGSNTTSFIKEIGKYDHFILFTIPNFFKLNEDIATSLSLFLIDVYHNEKYERGYFNFYWGNRKNDLHSQGKRMIGTISKYQSSSPSSRGRFSKFNPLAI